MANQPETSATAPQPLDDAALDQVAGGTKATKTTKSTVSGKRTEVKDASDRYANVEVGYL